MEAVIPPDETCATCHQPLTTDGGCLACLLRGGLEDPFSEETLAYSTLPAPPRSAPVYGDFEIDRHNDGSLWELGRGGMGATYKATDRVLHRSVALKVIRLGIVGTAVDNHLKTAMRERFLREARAAASLRHGNVAGVYQFGAVEQADQCYYAMELIEGETLNARVRRDGPLDVSTALEVARQVCAALVAAARRGLIHRDLKPSNLMLVGVATNKSEAVDVKVIDFGLAKATVATGETDLTHGGFVGTPAFASPEQFDGQSLDARTDLYSLGSTLWFALTGRPPFSGRSLEELRDDPRRARLPLEQLTARRVPPCVVTLLERVLALDPAGRPAAAKELLGALDVCRQQLSAAKAPKIGRGWLVAATAAVIGVVAVTGMIWQRTHAPKVVADHRPVLATAPEKPVTPPVPDKSVVVLPFDNFSQEKDSVFIADGVQDAILTDLAKVAELKVISRSSVMQYKAAKERNVREIGKALGVSHIVEGSVQTVGNKIRVTAQLIDARADTHQWAERYDRDISDVFAMQSEIAKTVADQLRSNLSLQEKAAIAERPTVDLKAYELYTKARAIDPWDTPGGAIPNLTDKAVLLGEAVQRDPAFALAYCELAKAQFDMEDVIRDGSHLVLGKAAVETALQLKPGLGLAYRELARYSLFTADFEHGSEDAAIAMALCPTMLKHFAWLPRSRASGIVGTRGASGWKKPSRSIPST